MSEGWVGQSWRAAEHLAGADRASMELCGIGAGSHRGWWTKAHSRDRPAGQLGLLCAIGSGLV